MNKNSVKCPRCGREYDLTIEKVFKGVSCPHCNKKMMMDTKTKKRLKLFRYIFVCAISIAVMFSAKEALETSMAFGILLVMALLAVMYTLSQYADRLCGRLLFHTFGFTYTEYVEIENKKVKRKQYGFYREIRFI